MSINEGSSSSFFFLRFQRKKSFLCVFVVLIFDVSWSLRSGNANMQLLLSHVARMLFFYIILLVDDLHNGFENYCRNGPRLFTFSFFFSDSLVFLVFFCCFFFRSHAYTLRRGIHFDIRQCIRETRRLYYTARLPSNKITLDPEVVAKKKKKKSENKKQSSSNNRDIKETWKIK